MIVTIGGRSGAGKTSVGRALAKRLGYKFYSMGDLRGKMAMERGMTIDELNEIGKKEAWTDKEVDEYQKKIGKKEDNFVVEGWLSFYFIPHSYKVFLDVDLGRAAERIFKHQRPDEPRQPTVAGVAKMISKRMRESQARYRKYYRVDCFSKKYYDAVINTSDLTVEKVVDKIIIYLKEKYGRAKTKRKSKRRN